MKSKFLTWIVLDIIILILIYTSFSFVLAELNPFHWDQDARMGFITLWLLISIALIGAIDMHKLNLFKN